LIVPLTKIQQAIREEDLSGWLFFNMRHRDKIADQVLGIAADSMNSRPWFYFIPAEGEPVKLSHSIESAALDTLPGIQKYYFSRQELTEGLKALADTASSAPSSPSPPSSPSAGPAQQPPVAVQYSKEITAISYLDYGTALLLQEAGFELFSSAGLIQRTMGVLTEKEIDSHRRAALHLYEIVEKTWKMVQNHFSGKGKDELYEGELRDFIEDEFDKRGLITEHPPIVGSGLHSADPHYMASGRGSAVKAGDVIQLDIFAREKNEGSIYADISWVGICSEAVPEHVRQVFEALKTARDSAVDLIRTRLSQNDEVRGAEVDRYVRKILADRGLDSNMSHRTGHAIDTEIHGSGANIDGIEFPDNRALLEGSCFSIEPGVYLEEFGLRTEIDVFIKNNEPVISGKEPQKALLTLYRED
jgi:Xaa-Pro aminopeptidase